jgi:hypothetical protein
MVDIFQIKHECPYCKKMLSADEAITEKNVVFPSRWCCYCKKRIILSITKPGWTKSLFR